MIRKTASVVAIALTFSQVLGPDVLDLPLRSAATLPPLWVDDVADDLVLEGTEERRERAERRRGASLWTRPLKHTPQPTRGYDRCFETSLVMSNMLTCALPANTSLSLSSALIMRRFLASCKPCFLM